MRYHGHARVNARSPESWAVCDRCGFIYNHVDLQWQFDWRGPRQQNLRILVCESCLDKPFEHNRTLILPPDPVAIANARPENYTADNNPVSPVSFDPLTALLLSADPANIGNMTQGAGLDAPFALSGLIAPSAPGAPVAALYPSWSYNWLGKFWSYTTLPPILPGFTTSGNNSLQYGIGSFSMQAPADQSFLASGSTAVVLYGWDGTNWNQLWAGQSAGTAGENLTATVPTTTPYYAHAITIAGDGSRAAVAALRMNASGDGVLAPTVSEPGPPVPTSPIFAFLPPPVSFIDSAPILDTPALTVIGGWLLTPTSLQAGSPILGAPTLSTFAITGLLATPLTAGSPLLGTPPLMQGHVLQATSFLDSAPILGAPSPSVGQGLAAVSLAAGSPTLGTPAISQNQILAAVPFVDSVPILGIPIVGLTIGFSVTSQPLTPTLGAPLMAIIGGSVITLNPATPIVTQAAKIDIMPRFSIPFVATGIATSKPLVDTTPAFVKH